ncbi:hypothetical protein PAPYR_4202 [Paratrimastix pyriformis]|uniref:Uncharacterized protein n=1 Tax=Paratrimastix pyriformis TaxID=342808 RepID=A0ABQ8UKR9_9EUKA|nr:hypothetical protein PAPYR_4202 [Paratrimastix pyriformis]
MEKATEDEPFMEDVAGTLELLGARLRCLCLRGTFPAWPQLAAALGRLPRLAELALYLLTAPGDLVLACPALQRLTLSANRFRSVVFDCPRLELLVIGIILRRLERFEPAGGHPPPNLCVRMQPHLAERFPWLQQRGGDGGRGGGRKGEGSELGRNMYPPRAPLRACWQRRTGE